MKASLFYGVLATAFACSIFQDSGPDGFVAVVAAILAGLSGYLLHEAETVA